MKKAAFIAGTIGVIFAVLALFLKMHHLEDAGFISFIAIACCWVIALPIMAIYVLTAKLPNKNLYLYGIISTFVLFAGILFKMQHYPANDWIQIIGTVLFIIFAILFALNLYKSPKEKE